MTQSPGICQQLVGFFYRKVCAKPKSPDYERWVADWWGPRFDVVGPVRPGLAETDGTATDAVGALGVFHQQAAVAFHSEADALDPIAVGMHFDLLAGQPAAALPVGREMRVAGGELVVAGFQRAQGFAEEVV